MLKYEPKKCSVVPVDVMLGSVWKECEDGGEEDEMYDACVCGHVVCSAPETAHTAHANNNPAAHAQPTAPTRASRPFRGPRMMTTASLYTIFELVQGSAELHRSRARVLFLLGL